MLIPEGLMPLREAAKLVPGGGCHKSTLLRWIRFGCRGSRLKAKRIAARWFVTEQALVDFFDACARSQFPDLTPPKLESDDRHGRTDSPRLDRMHDDLREAGL